jgi:Fe-S oxidoreductase
MAKLKSEFLQGYHDARGLTRRDRMIGTSSEMAERIAGWKAPWVNAIQSLGPFKKLLESVTGFDSRRRLPVYASTTFLSWCEGRSNGKKEPAESRCLRILTPISQLNIGREALSLLESVADVLVIRPGCCQRPRISHGLLREAKQEGMKTVRGLDEYLRQGLSVVVCEPSCASAFTDDWPDLLDDDALGERLKFGVQMIDVFLAKEIDAGNLNCEFASPHKKILIHGHCHQKALYGTGAMKKILAKVPGLEVNEVDSGCCGMAGSFVYEKEHYSISKTIAEYRLLPAIRNLNGDTQVVACGFSCRHQIADFGNRKAVHWVETLKARVV